MEASSQRNVARSSCSSLVRVAHASDDHVDEVGRRGNGPELMASGRRMRTSSTSNWWESAFRTMLIMVRTSSNSDVHCRLSSIGSLQCGVRMGNAGQRKRSDTVAKTHLASLSGHPAYLRTA